MDSEEDHKYTNHLINETSPYLLQHAHNPVDWYPWGDEALAKAKKEDKPIIISIGYSACHWCHVMERESFEDTTVAKLMNEKFVCIKVDREERPDLDNIYMSAVQIMGIGGGWPLNVFLTPDAKPFFGGTYFPPKASHDRQSWTQILQSVSMTFRRNRNQIEKSAAQITASLESNSDNAFVNIELEGSDFKKLFSPEQTEAVYQSLKKKFDTKEGGFGRAPKFPNTMNIKYLLRHHYFTGDQEALDHALLSLNKMIRGGIYDQVGGGFARYSTDRVWLAPHFEKMLYDNALLVGVIAEAYMVTGMDIYRNTIEETLTYIKREMTNDEGGFYCTLDADSEGEEGKFYVFTYEEIKKILKSRKI
ncbi:MAG: thioredoxin domain-containing protein [Bacteroidetes bacterium]|nr:thioredoxin domain-containing protein [Bacteroidota bacterium]